MTENLHILSSGVNLSVEGVSTKFFSKVTRTRWVGESDSFRRLYVGALSPTHLVREHPLVKSLKRPLVESLLSTFLVSDRPHKKSLSHQLIC